MQIRRRAHPWLAHSLAMFAVLFVALWFGGTQGILSADEGAALVQARVVQQTDQWAMRSDPVLDPGDRWFPIHLGNQVGLNHFPFTRPPLYPLLVGWLLQLGGLTLVLAAHTAAVGVAAIGAGRVAERLRPGWGITAMWATAVATPLLFDGAWAIAHSIVAATFMWATWGAVRCVVDGQRWAAVVAVGAVGLGAGLRNEMVVAAAALALGILVVGRGRWVRAGGLASGVAAAGLVGYKVMNLTQRWVEGGSSTPLYRPDYRSGFWSGRWSGFQHAVLGSGLNGGAAAALLTVGALATAAGVLMVVVPRWSTRWGLGLCVAGTVAALVRMAMAPDLVNGLAIVAPGWLAWFAVTPRSIWRDPVGRLVGSTTVAGLVGVCATQSPQGGVGEWGGRYFHFVVAPLVVVAVCGVADRARSVGQPSPVDQPSPVRWAAVVGLVGALALSVCALREIRLARDAATTLTRTTWSVARSVSPNRRPVVISTWVPGGRFAWEHVLHARYLTVADPADFPALGRALARAHVDVATMLVEPADRSALDRIAGYRVDQRVRIGSRGWQVVTVVRTGEHSFDLGEGGAR